ncbi:MAG: hypothetical protein NXI20_21690 [bacterium]|nr:hypothetical protein [bacterium]
MDYGLRIMLMLTDLQLEQQFLKSISLQEMLLGLVLVISLEEQSSRIQHNLQVLMTLVQEQLLFTGQQQVSVKEV